MMILRSRLAVASIFLIIMILMTGFVYFLYKNSFANRFEEAVYWPDRSSVYAYPDSQLALRVVGFEDTEKLFSVLNKAGKYGELEEVINGNALVHSVVFSDNFSEDVRANEDEFYLRYHTPLFTLKNREEFIEQNKKCLFSSSANSKREIVLSLLLVNTSLNEKEMNNCLLLYYLKMNGVSNIYYSDIDKYVEENDEGIVLTMFSKAALSVLKNSSEALLKSKQEMLSFIESSEFTDTKYPDSN